MKKRALIAVLCMILTFVVAHGLVGCFNAGVSDSSSSTITEYTVTLKHDENSHFTADNYELTVEEGGTATFTLTLEEGYVLSGASVGTLDGNVLTVANVKTDTEVEVVVVVAEYTVTLKHDENSHFSADKYETTVHFGETATFALTFEDGYVLFGSTGVIENNVLTVSNVIENTEVEILLVHEDAIFEGFDDLTDTSNLYGYTEGMSNFTIEYWNVSADCDLTAFSMNTDGSPRCMIYAVGNLSKFVVNTLLYNDSPSHEGVVKISYSTDGGKTYTEIPFEEMEIPYFAKGPAGNEWNFIGHSFIVSGDLIPAHSLVKINLPEIAGNWYDYSILSVEAYGYYDVSLAESEHYSLVSSNPESLEGIAYNEEVQLTIAIAEGYRLVESGYANYGIASAREGEITLTLNTKDLPLGGAQVVLSVEEIPVELTVALKHDENSHFTADVYETTVLLDGTATFTLTLEEGYVLFGASAGTLEGNVLTVANVIENTEIEILLVHEDAIFEGFDDLTDTSNLYGYTEGMSNFTIDWWNVAEGCDLTAFSMNSDGSTRYMIYAVGNISSFTVNTLLYNDSPSSAGVVKISYSTDGGKTYTEIPFEEMEIPYFAKGPAGNEWAYVGHSFIVSGDLIPAHSLVKINLPEIAGHWYDYSILSVEASSSETEELAYIMASAEPSAVMTLNTATISSFGGVKSEVGLGELPVEFTVTLKHDENSLFTADKYEVAVAEDGTATFALNAVNGYVLFGASLGVIENNVLTISNVNEDTEIEIFVIPEDKIFKGCDDLVDDGSLYESSEGMGFYSYNTWDVKDSADLTAVSVGGSGSSRYLTYAVGKLSGFSVWTRIGGEGRNEKFVISISTDGGKTFTPIADENVQFEDVASGPAGSGSYYDQRYYVSGEFIPVNSLVEIRFPEIGGNWWDVSVLKVEAYETYTVTVADSDYYSVVSTNPATLEGLGYGENIEITIKIEEGWRLAESNYTNYGTASDRAGEIVLSLNTADLPLGGAEIILSVEEIPVEVTVTLVHDENSHFTADQYVVSLSEIGSTAVFNNVNIEDGYVFAGIDLGVYDAINGTITLTNVEDNQVITFVVKESKVQEIGSISLGSEETMDHLFDKSSNVVWGQNDGGQITTDDWSAGYVVYQFDESVSAVTLKFMFKGYWFNNNCLPTIKVSADNMSYTPVEFGKDTIIAILGANVNSDSYYTVDFTVVMADYEFLRIDFAATAENDSYNKFKLNKEIVARAYQSVEIESGEHFTVTGDKEVAYGANAVFTVTLDDGYDFYLVNELELDEYNYDAEKGELTIYNVKGQMSLTLMIVQVGQNPLVEIVFVGNGYSMPDGMTYTAQAGTEFTVEVTPNFGAYFLSSSTGSYDAESNTFTMIVPERTATTEVELNFKVPVFPTKNTHLDDLTDANKLFESQSGISFERYDADVPMRDLTVVAGQGKYLVYFLSEKIGAVKIIAYANNSNVGVDATFAFSKDNQNYSAADSAYINKVVTQLSDYYSNITYTVQVTDEDARFIKITLPSNTGAWWDWSIASVEIFPIFNVEVEPSDNCTAEVISVNPGGVAEILINPASGYVFHYAYDSDMNAVGTYNSENNTLTIKGIYEDLKLNLYVLPEGEAAQWLVSVRLDENIIFGESGRYTFVNNGADAVFYATFKSGYSFESCEGASYDESTGTLTVYNVQKPVVVTLKARESAFEQKTYTVQVIDSQGSVVGSATGVKRGESATISLTLPNGVEVTGVTSGTYNKETNVLVVERVDGNMTVRVETVVKPTSNQNDASNDNKVTLIVIGSILGVAVICVGVVLFIKIRRKKNG